MMLSSLLQKLLTEKNLQALFIASPVHIAYLTGYHGFSLVEREAYLILTRKKHYLITDGRYIEEVSAACPEVTVLQRSANQPTAKLLANIIQKHEVSQIGFEPEVVTVSEYKQLKTKDLTFVPVSLRDLRKIKTSQEISEIQKACEIGDKTFTYIQTQIKVGMSEKEIANLMELFIKQQGAEISFSTIVAFGKNAAIPHHHTDDTKLKTGDCILLDFGVKYKNYCSDMTRTIFLGKPSSEQTHIYETVKNAQKKAIDHVNQQVRIMNQDHTKPLFTRNIDKAARDYIIAEGYPSIPHGLGHGIGLEVHEAPSLSPLANDKLEEGMVFSIEPGIYLSDKNIGVRIEDLCTIQNRKLIQLTKSSREIIVIS